jgi:two-component system cell cycle sensor histidine kinase/response regulator CckA
VPDEQYQELFEHFADPLFIEDASGLILDANHAAATLLGIAREELTGSHSSNFLAQASLERLSPLIKALRPGGRLELDVQYVSAASTLIDVHLIISVIPWAAGGKNASTGKNANTAFLVTARPSNDRYLMEQELRAYRSSAVTSVFGLPKALFYVSSQNTVTRYPHSDPAPADGGAAELPPLEWVKNLLLSPALKKALDRAWSGEEVILPPAWYSEKAVPAGANISGAMAAVAKEAHLTEVAGEKQHWLRISLSPLKEHSGINGILAQVLDVTLERINAERDDVAEDQTVLAMLTSSIHHELNNYLSVIIAQASAMRMSIPHGQLPPPNIGAIMDAGHEAVSLLRRSADLLGRVDGAIPETDLNTIVSDTAHVLRHMLPTGFTVRTDLSVDVPHVRADVRMMRTLILVLARHLQTRLTGGTVTLKTYRPEQVHPTLLQAALSIEDTGSRPATAGAAPRPVFAGHGMEAPSIALARAIARYHRAQLEVITNAQGSVLEITLPGIDLMLRDGALPLGSDPVGDGASQGLTRGSGEGMGDSVPMPHDPLQLTETPAGKPRVLVADDEENFRSFMGWSLRQAGYDVILASNGQEAFERFQESPGSICLAILDAYMPLMGGLETYLRMQVLKPELPVLFASGFVRGPSVETLIDGCPGPATVLLKPFSSEDLIKAVETALTPVPEGDEEEQALTKNEE